MLIYLHGFNGFFGGQKEVEGIRRLLPDYIDLEAPWFSSHNPRVAYLIITAMVEEAFDQGIQPIMMGRSLGGYWAQYFAHKYDLKAIMINPMLEPYETLKMYVGHHGDFITKKVFELTENEIANYRQYDIQSYTLNQLPHIILDAGDTIVDPIQTALKYKGKCTYDLFPDGSHGFMHWNEAREGILTAYHESII